MEETADNQDSGSSQSELEDDSSELPKKGLVATSTSTCNRQCCILSQKLPIIHQNFKDPTLMLPDMIKTAFAGNVLIKKVTNVRTIIYC